jgi:hypothetical protein
MMGTKCSNDKLLHNISSVSAPLGADSTQAVRYGRLLSSWYSAAKALATKDAIEITHFIVTRVIPPR